MPVVKGLVQVEDMRECQVEEPLSAEATRRTGGGRTSDGGAARTVAEVNEHDNDDDDNEHESQQFKALWNQARPKTI
jgi:hypothetical protein